MNTLKTKEALTFRLTIAKQNLERATARFKNASNPSQAMKMKAFELKAYSQVLRLEGQLLVA